MKFLQRALDKFRKPKKKTVVEFRQDSPELDRFVAAGELERGELRHGVTHLASLLAFSPDHPDSLALLKAYRAKGKILELLPP